MAHMDHVMAFKVILAAPQKKHRPEFYPQQTFKKTPDMLTCWSASWWYSPPNSLTFLSFRKATIWWFLPCSSPARSPTCLFSCGRLHSWKVLQGSFNYQSLLLSCTTKGQNGKFLRSSPSWMCLQTWTRLWGTLWTPTKQLRCTRTSPSSCCRTTLLPAASRSITSSA